MLETEFKADLRTELEFRFPGCMVLHLDPTEVVGIPDLLILSPTGWWATLEAKRSEKEFARCMRTPHGRTQRYYVDLMNNMSFSAFIYPENMEEILNEMERSFEARGHARISKCK